MSRLASVAGNRSMQGLAGLSRSSAARVSGDDDQAGRHSRRRSGRGRRQRSGSGATDSRSSQGEWRRRVVTARRRCGSPLVYLPSINTTTAGDRAEGWQTAMPYLTAFNASGAANNARCRATRGRSRRGFIARGSALVPREATRQTQGKPCGGQSPRWSD